ncbi:MAG: MDR family oxidoreductase [Dichotomicrobium sp.]
MEMFRALRLDETDGRISASIADVDDNALPEGDVTVAVDYSTLNYKDGMVVNGLGKLVRTYPHVPGIDFSGTVEESDNPKFGPGDKVLLTGWHVGERHWGGYAEKARVKADWLTRIPEGLSTFDAMAVGTAGFTAMLAIMALEEHGLSKDGDVLVTGASGGVGSVAVAILAQCGYRPVALTGRTNEADYLTGLGAVEIVARESFLEGDARPLEAERWAGCVDAVGGAVLGRVLAQLRYGGSVAAVGLAGGPKLETTVMPFLLRGINLLGIDSVLCPSERREAAWQRIAKDLPMDKLHAMTQTAALGDIPRLASAILKGDVRGRMVIDVRA